jgi:DNA-binding winged helix-turn-helix (wHTH) protein/Tol biopolymer transport system component
MEVLPDDRFRFDDFELDCAKRELRHRGEPVKLKSKTFDLLQYLVQNHGKLVTKADLLDQVWPGQFVEENNLTVQISALRKVFTSSGGQFIKTIPGKGYTFVGQVEEASEELIVEQRSFSRLIIEESVSSEPQPVATPKMDAFRAAKHAAIGATASVMLLAVLGFVYWRTSVKPAKPEFRLSSVTSSGDITSATTSPDGRYAVFARKAVGGETLWLRQLEGGSERQIQEVKPHRYTGLAISPDGGSIYATTFSPQLPDPQLMRIPLLGGMPEIIPNITTGAAVSISPDGTRIAYTESRSSMKQTQLLTSKIDGTGKKVIARGEDDKRSFPNFNVNPVAWSPDGRWIAVAVEEKGETLKNGIMLIAPETGEEKMLSENRWRFVGDVAWIDNENIAFSAFPPELSSGQVWSISRLTGEAARLTNDLAGYGWISTGRRGILSVRQTAVSRITTGEIDTTSDRLALTEVFSESGAIQNVEFARDGSLLYTSAASGRREVWRLGSHAWPNERLTNGAQAIFGLSAARGEDKVAFGGVENDKYVVKIATLDGRSMRTITDGPEEGFPVFSPDGRSIIFQKGIYNRTITAWRLDLDGFRETQLSDATSIWPSISPNGSSFAYYLMDPDDGIWKIGLRSTSDGSVMGKISFPVPVNDRRMRWLGDSTIVQIVYAGEQVNLLLIPTDGSPHKIIETNARGDVDSFAISKDDKSIAISTSELRNDIVTLTR